MALFWMIWTFVGLGLTAWGVDATANRGVSPAWIMVAGGSALWSAFMVYLTWPR